MLKNYLKTALRNLLREKGNTSINIAGLTLGITGSIVLFLIVNHGASFDNYHINHDQIYRVVSKSQGNNGFNFTQGIPAPLPEAFKSDFANEVKEVAFTSYRRESLITVNTVNGITKKYEEPKGLVFTEPSFFKIFDREMLSGSTEKGLDQPNEAIISKKWALKYFGHEDAVGESVEYDGIEYIITGVMEDYPSNTDFPFDLILSYITIRNQMDTRAWGDISDTDNCYFLTKNDESIAKIESQIPAFVTKYLGNDGSKANENSLILQPLHDLHSDSRFGNYNSKLPKEAQIVFIVIAIFLLITACINFINLTTAEAIKRTKEVGIRKVLGSTRRQLVIQFMGEAFIVTLLSVALSILGSQILLGFINPFMELSLALNLNSDSMVWLFLGVLTITVTVFSGLYPALLVSAFKPVLAIKNQISSKVSSGYTMRKGLVVLQFFISQFFIIATIVIVKQMDFIQKQDVGFAKDAIITVPIPAKGDALESKGSKIRALKNELLILPGVEKVSLNYAPPSFKAVFGTTFSVEGNDDEYDTQVKQVDGDYISLYNLELIAGDKLPDLDTISGLVVNEKLVKVAGFKSNDEIIGKQISFWGKLAPVKGVVKDFNTTSLSKPIEPVVLLNNVDGYQSLSLKLHPSEMQKTIQQGQKKWEAVYPEYVFSYNFLDEQIRDLYKGERRISVILSAFSSIAIFIGCLGLLGLVTYMANQKTKEIGVRKVLGASVGNIMILFSKQFVKLVLLGFVFAAPPVWFVMTKLLEQFAYKISLGPIIFLTGLAITFLIAMLTVGFRSFKASIANPIRSLRSE